MTFKQYIQSLTGKRVAVVGMGISNTPLIERLLDAGIETLICDKRGRDDFSESLVKFENLGVKFRLGEQYLANLDADIIFRTPGLMPTDPDIQAAVSRGAALTSEMEVFFQVCPCKTIGITGSDGKTTTTSVIAELLRREGSRTIHVGGNIGAPLLCKADNMSPEDIAVLELSSFQLVSMRQSPDIAVVTNLAPNHLDVHNDMEEYAEAKSHIFAHQKSTDTAVFNFDNDFTRVYAEAAPSKNIQYFSRRERVHDGVFLENRIIYQAHDGHAGEIMAAEDILLPGMHNVENFMAAFAAVRGLVSREIMAVTARTFNGVAHRIELVRELNGVRFYNDSIATSPTRTIAGLKSFRQKVVLIAGGKDKGVPFDELGTEIISCVKTLVLTGNAAEMIRQTVINAPGYAAGSPEIIMQPDFANAIKSAASTAERGDVVILSPACSSFDRFKNFEERGNAFREIVKGL